MKNLIVAIAMVALATVGAWAGVDLALGFEEYAQGTPLTEENCSALMPNKYATLNVFDNGGDVVCAGGFTPPFTSAGTNAVRIKTTLGSPCSFGFKKNNVAVEILEGHPYCVDFLARFTAFDDVYYLPRSASSALLAKGKLQKLHIDGEQLSIVVMRSGFGCSIDDSIRLWQLERFDPYTDEPIATNWCVTAGDGSGGVTNYVLTALGDEPIPNGDATECDGGSSGWHRITFKACRAADSDSLFFKLFIGRRQVRAGDTTDFPSMAAGTSVSSLRFDGQGDVDNIVACEEPPPEIRNVTARQRWPWNGLVDITCEVTGIDESNNDLHFVLEAVNQESASTNRLSNFWVVKDGKKSTDRNVHGNGSYRFLWDACADFGEVVYSNMVLTVKIKTHDKVQLWEGGPYWATTNIGADMPEDYGYYFWWGDTVGYKWENDAWVASDGSSSNFSFDSANTPTYNKDLGILQSEGWITASGELAPEYDAAHVHLGGYWRMPTKDELSALSNRCDWTWATTNGVEGYIVSGKGDYATASIFIPTSGLGIDTSLDAFDMDSLGCYWSSVPDSDNGRCAWVLAFYSRAHVTATGLLGVRPAGLPVRPVNEAPAWGALIVSVRDSAPFILDTMESPRQSIGNEMLCYSSLWGGDAGATVTIAQNGVAIAEGLTGEDTYSWSVQKAGTYVLTHTTYTNGIVGKVESATFNVPAKDIGFAQVNVDCSDVTYRGTAYEPALQSVKWGDDTLVAGVDFTLAYSDNVNAGTATITLTGINFYNGTYTTNFTIRPRALTQGMVGAIGNHPYTGKAQTPKPMVTDVERGVTLREDVEYTLSYANNTAIGEGIVTVTGKGNYTGSIARTFVIEPSSGSELEESLGGAGKAESDGKGGWIVTLTNYVDVANLPIVIPDNLGNVTIDLNGHDLIGPDGESGGFIETALPVIRIVPGDEEGEPTQLTIVTSGGDAIVQGGDGAPAIEVVDGVQEGVLINIGDGVTVRGGGDDVVAIDGEVGENSGTIVKATYDMSSAAWNYSAPFTYDGTKKSVEVTGLPSGVTVASYEGNVATSPRTYTAHATFAYDAANYNEPSIADCRWTILPSDEWAGVDLALGFEEYAPETVLTEETCSTLTLSENAYLKVFDNGGDIGYSGEFAQPFTSAGTNGLSVKTDFGQPCAFRLAEGNADIEISAGHPYRVDFLARFTVFDEAPEASLYSPRSAAHASLSSPLKVYMRRPGFICYIDDDIMLYRQEVFDFNDEPVATNWWIRAGNGAGGSADYVLTTETGDPLVDNDSGWRRVTFKVCRAEGSDVLFFNVFIDGRQLRSGETTDFPSLTTRTSVGTVRFDGQGDVDNIVTGEDVPFAPGDVTVSSYSNKYDGAAHGITVTSDIPGITYKYASGALGESALPGEWSTVVPTLTDVGSMVVWVEVSAPGYITQTNSATVTISKRSVTVTVTGHTAEYVYDGSEKYVEGFDLATDDELYDFNAKTYFGGVSFSAKRTDVGTSYMGLAAPQFANADANFEVTYVVTDGWLRITKATYDMSAARWDYSGDFEYDGKVKTVQVVGLPPGVTVASYAGNTATNPGTYTAHATLGYDATNYSEPALGDLRWVIKAPYKLTLKSVGAKYGTVSGSGTYAYGSKATLKAKAKKGYVFAGWFTDKACKKALNPKGYDNRSPTVKYAMPAKNTTVYAKFVTKATDKESLKFTSATKKLAKTATKGEAGAAFSLKLGIKSASFPTVTAKGLPKGLRIDKTTGAITGTPAKPGSFTVTVTVKDAAGYKITQNVKIEVSVPSWARGTLYGTAKPGKSGDPSAYLKFDIGKTGKVSGKITWKGDAYSFTSSLASCTASKATFSPKVKIGKATFKPGTVTMKARKVGGLSLVEAANSKRTFVAQKKPNLVKKGKALAALVGWDLTFKRSDTNSGLVKSKDKLTVVLSSGDTLKVTGMVGGKKLVALSAPLLASGKTTADGVTTYTLYADIISASPKYERTIVFTVTVGPDGRIDVFGTFL